MRSILASLSAAAYVTGYVLLVWCHWNCQPESWGYCLVLLGATVHFGAALARSSCP